MRDWLFSLVVFLAAIVLVSVFLRGEEGRRTIEQYDRVLPSQEFRSFVARQTFQQDNSIVFSQKFGNFAAANLENTKKGLCKAYSPVGRGPFGVGKFRPIPKAMAAALTPHKFYQSYVVPNKPVLISGAAANLFHDFDTFGTISRLHTSNFAGEKQPVRQLHVRLAGCCIDGQLNVSEIFTNPTRTIHFEAVPFGKLLESPLVEHRLGLKQEYFRKMRNKTFLQSFGPSEASLSSNQDTNTFNLHLSNQGGAIPHSHRTTLNVCLQGAKRWIMVDPLDYPSDEVRVIYEQIDRMQAQRSVNVQFSYTSQDWFMNEAAALLKSLGVPYHDFVQEQGDAVYIPDFWAHATIDLCRETMGVELMGDFVHSGYSPPSTLRWKEGGQVASEVFFAKKMEQSRPIAWIHIPKAGASFANTLFSSLCPGEVSVVQPDLPLHVVMQEVEAKDLCSGAWSPFYESPPGHVGAGGIWQHEVKHKVVALFRQPEQRHISAWLHDQHSARDAKNMEEYLDRVRGCQVKVLMRRGGDPRLPMSGPCGDPAPVAQSEIEEAIKHVMDDFLFVGLTEEYALSVCLWHTMLGGECKSHEFVNSRPGRLRRGEQAITGSGSEQVKVTAYDVNEYLGKWTDEADGQLYNAAVRRFNLDLAIWGVTKRKCAERICPGQAQYF